MSDHPQSHTESVLSIAVAKLQAADESEALRSELEATKALLAGARQEGERLKAEIDGLRRSLNGTHETIDVLRRQISDQVAYADTEGWLKDLTKRVTELEDQMTQPK